MPITGVLGQGWGSPTDWSGINPRNNRKDHHDQAKDHSSAQERQKSYARSEVKADGFELGTGGVSQSFEVSTGWNFPQEISRVHHNFPMCLI
ncbi:hypothetical protein Tco_1509906 [Tanacetum coccineum]